MIEIDEYDALLRRAPRLWKQPCQLVTPTLAQVWEQIDQKAIDMARLVQVAATVTPSGSLLARALAVTRLLNELTQQVELLRAEVAR